VPASGVLNGRAGPWFSAWSAWCCLLNAAIACKPVPVPVPVPVPGSADADAGRGLHPSASCGSADEGGDEDDED